MYFSLTNNFDVSGMKSVVHKGVTVSYFGFPIKLGCTLGDASIISLIDEYLESGIDFSSIYGHFYLSLYDHDKDEKLFFSDNSGICKIYFNSCCLSSSLLKILENNNSSRLNPEGVIEFLQFGSVFFNQTVVEGVQTLSRKKVVKSENEFISPLY